MFALENCSRLLFFLYDLSATRLNSGIPKRGRSKRGRSQKEWKKEPQNEHNRECQNCAKESAKRVQRAQMSAKERLRVMSARKSGDSLECVNAFFKWGFCNLVLGGGGKGGGLERGGEVGEGLGRGWGRVGEGFGAGLGGVREGLKRGLGRGWDGVGEGLGRAWISILQKSEGREWGVRASLKTTKETKTPLFGTFATHVLSGLRVALKRLKVASGLKAA